MPLLNPKTGGLQVKSLRIDIELDFNSLLYINTKTIKYINLGSVYKIIYRFLYKSISNINNRLGYKSKAKINLTTKLRNITG